MSSMTIHQRRWIEPPLVRTNTLPALTSEGAEAGAVGVASVDVAVGVGVGEVSDDDEVNEGKRGVDEGLIEEGATEEEEVGMAVEEGIAVEEGVGK